MSRAIDVHFLDDVLIFVRCKRQINEFSDVNNFKEQNNSCGVFSHIHVKGIETMFYEENLIGRNKRSFELSPLPGNNLDIIKD